MNTTQWKSVVVMLFVFIGSILIVRQMNAGDTLLQYEARKNAVSEETGAEEVAAAHTYVTAPVEIPAVTDQTSEAAAETIPAEDVTIGDTPSSASADEKTPSAGTETADIPEPFSEPDTHRITVAEGFTYEEIPDEIFAQMEGISYPADPPADGPARSDLRYCRLRYVDFDGNDQEGELVCHADIAQDVCEIFAALYAAGYEIERIRLIDAYDGDDTASMTDNNTSCFNYRLVEGTTRLSRHALGMAIDINPFYNPYITWPNGEMRISPAGSEAYADRSKSFPYKIDRDDLAYRLFTEHGFTWGGDWNSVKDYQHFERSQ